MYGRYFRTIHCRHTQDDDSTSFTLVINVNNGPCILLGLYFARTIECEEGIIIK